MPIISLSLDEKILKELDKLGKTMGFSGRSEIVRASVKHFIDEKEGAEKLTGSPNVVILATHSEHADQTMAGISQRFEDIIVTHLHNKTKSSKCLETFIVSGSAERVKKMFKTLQSSRKVDYVKLLAI